MTSAELEEALYAVGELLKAEKAREAIVVVGGASLSLLGLIPRTTQDVDVIARVDVEDAEVPLSAASMIPPEPFPEILAQAIHTVARDFGLPADWINADVALQWHSGLPPGLQEEIVWREYEALSVGLAGRRALIALKLFAAVDGGPGGVHYQDLRALHPTSEELEQAAIWVRTQDVSPVFLQMIDEVVALVQQQR